MPWDAPPPLLDLPDEAAYRDYYDTQMCVPGGVVEAQCGYTVRFFREKFDDAFFNSRRGTRNKANFSFQRAQRMPWIGWTLQNPRSIACIGWDRDEKMMHQDRLSIVVTWTAEAIQCQYAVIIRLKQQTLANFITAYDPGAEDCAKMLRARV